MNTRSRYIVIIIAVIFLAYAVVSDYYYLCVYILGLIGYVVWSQYREGTVALATQSFPKKDYEKTRQLLSEIRDPDQLRKGRRNFYEFMKGSLALQGDRLEDAEYHFQLASRLHWRKENEKGMVLIYLANINLRKKDYDRVDAYVEVAEKLKLTPSQQNIINKIKEDVKKYK